MRWFLGMATVSLVALWVSAAAADPKKEFAPPTPQAEKVGPDRYRVGVVMVDTTAKTLEFPARIGLRRGALEYLITPRDGKTHETLLITDASALEFQVAALLLDLEPGGGVRRQGDSQAPRGPEVELTVAWRRRDQTGTERSVRVAAETLVWDMKRRAPMGSGAWVLSGIEANRFGAGDPLGLVAIYRDPDAVVNNRLPGGADDTTYKVNERVLPPTGVPVQVRLRVVP